MCVNSMVRSSKTQFATALLGLHPVQFDLFLVLVPPQETTSSDEAEEAQSVGFTER